MATEAEMKKQGEKIIEVARAVGADPSWLDAMINFETGGTYSTTVKNPNSSARGLIQLTDAAARDLGFPDSLAAVSRNTDFYDQMDNIVRPYLENRMRVFNNGRPLSSPHQLLMAVFYPAYMKESATKEFPVAVQKANTYTIGGVTSTIRTPADYMAFVMRRIKAMGAEASLRVPKAAAVGAGLIALAALAAFLILRGRRT